MWHGKRHQVTDFMAKARGAGFLAQWSWDRLLSPSPSLPACCGPGWSPESQHWYQRPTDRNVRLLSHTTLQVPMFLFAFLPYSCHYFNIQAIFKNSIILFVCSPKFCINFVSIFCRTNVQWCQEKIKTMVIQYFGGQTNSITVFLKMAYCFGMSFSGSAYACVQVS